MKSSFLIAGAPSGRVAETAEQGAGKCFRLYTAAFFEAKLAESTTAEIHRSSFMFTALHLVAGGIDKVFDFPFMDRPQPSDGESRSPSRHRRS